ncbi:Uncharacterised protein [uncultured archaeon]|nr:Uncharacterised protein [uncultured archaeon]
MKNLSEISINISVKEKTKSLLESLMEFPSQDAPLVIESRGNNIIAGAIKLIDTIEEQYGEELAENLEKRLLSSIHHRNTQKFQTGIKNLPIK